MNETNADVPPGSRTTLRGALLVEPGSRSPVALRGIERIRAQSPGPVDLLHGRAFDDPALAGYDWGLLLDKFNEDPVPAEPAGSPLETDAWAVEVSGERPARATIRTASERGRLYALYHIADCLREGRPQAAWTAQRRPLVARRYALIIAGNVWSPVCRPDLFDRDVVEAPGLGLNGVILGCTPAHGTSIGRQTIPFTIAEDGGIEVDRFKLPMFRAMCDRLKSYGLDICIFHQAFIPPGFTMDQVREFYDGRRELPGYLEKCREVNRALADAIFTHLPQVDSLLHHSLECEWFWGKAVSIFPCEDDAVGERAFETYLDALTDACGRHGKDLFFWAHICGISGRQIRLTRRVLARYPSVMVVEDNAWENCTWPNSPVMGYLTDVLKKDVTAGRFGLAINTTDGEYYGGGKLPSAYPDPHVRGARTAVELGAEMAFVRLNGQMLTPMGTLDDVNAINVLSVCEAFWEPARPIDECWTDWCSRRFGPATAPAVTCALQKSGTILTKGLSAARLGLIDHSGLSFGKWRPRSPSNAWALFAHPGKRLVEKPYDELGTADFKVWQVEAAGVEMDAFLRQSAAADAAAREALREIESVRSELKPEDFDYLSGCFKNALVIMEVVRRTARGARASALCLENSGGAADRELDEACAAMEALAEDIEAEHGPDFFRTHFFMKLPFRSETHSGYSVPLALRALAEAYRGCQRGAQDE